MQYLVSRRFNFEAAHKIEDHGGRCKNLHGHRWEFELVCQYEVSPSSGISLDFGVLKRIGTKIVDKLDHTYLNDLLERRNLTAEYLAWYILAATYEDLLGLYSVKIWETPDSCIELRKEDFTLAFTWRNSQRR